MTYYARSASPSAPNQPYSEHITNVLENAAHHWAEAARYWHGGGTAEALGSIIHAAAAFHDLGKLDDANQEILSGKNSRAPLPIPHQDAGVAHLFARKELLSALLVYAHHIGLPDFSDIQTIRPPLRIPDPDTRATIDQSLPLLLRRHEECGSPSPSPTPMCGVQTALDFRILFSCLTDADHGDAAQASGETACPPPAPALRAGERLEALKDYIASLPAAVSPEEKKRNELRSAFFEACLQSPTTAPLTECDAPVGTGKTTAVMAHLLRVAQANKLRRIFVILPFTNIIRQSVKVYRKALVLPGENPEEVVAEIHHRADFKDKESRRLTALWNAPIVVTTAVTFFETLASNQPATLRRLHNLPGSAVFLDESHAMLPAKLLPLAWHWINHTAEHWQCSWTLASGSLSRFWELTEFARPEPVNVRNILVPAIRSRLASAESARVAYPRKEERLSLSALSHWLTTLEGPVLVVLNTVQTAAAAAREAEGVFGAGNVLHLSTALSPTDRENTLEQAKSRLKDKGDTKWCLFATSCIEAGVDLSFRTGVREAATLASLLQLAGRVNRNAEFASADVWTVFLDATSPNVGINPAWTISARILNDLLEKDTPISPSSCTEALKRELREGGIAAELENLKKYELNSAFSHVDRNFRVIEDNSCPAVVDKALIERIERVEDVSWRDIQNGSVNIRKRLIDKLEVEESRRYPGLFLWKYDYTPFLGYMAGVLKLDDISSDSFALV
ncbi:MAG: DEAD/DEAH box helicase [Kiritimatiellia bacterium]|jgi:CRISPR-associated endonuclease/helicase Cas3